MGMAPEVAKVTEPEAKEKRGVPTSFTSPVRVISAASVTYSPAGMVRATEMSLFSSGAETVKFSSPKVSVMVRSPFCV